MTRRHTINRQSAQSRWTYKHAYKHTDIQNLLCQPCRLRLSKWIRTISIYWLLFDRYFQQNVGICWEVLNSFHNIGIQDVTVSPTCVRCFLVYWCYHVWSQVELHSASLTLTQVKVPRQIHFSQPYSMKFWGTVSYRALYRTVQQILYIQSGDLLWISRTSSLDKVSPYADRNIITVSTVEDES